MDSIQQSINNSYESERSSSNSSISESMVPETTPLNLHLPDLFAVSNADNVSIPNNMSDKYTNSDLEQIEYDSQVTQNSLRSSASGSAEISDQNERVLKEFEAFGPTKILKTLSFSQSMCLPLKKRYEKYVHVYISPSRMFDMENSCNASDNKISNEISSTQYNKDLSFRLNIANTSGGIKNSISTSTTTDTKVPANKAKKTPIKREELSPDLFADYSDSDGDGEETKDRFEDTTIIIPELSHTQNKSETNDWEKRLFKNLQISLSGVLPPPSKTIVQYNITELLTLYDENVKKMSTSNKNELVTESFTESLLKPSHTVDQIKTLNWEDMTMEMKCHGVHYNRSYYSENIELLCMKYAERCVGVETSSSFKYDCRPTINKTRMKLLSQSPGTRLSHLVRRKKPLSSVNLMSKQFGSDSSKLGSKQLVIDVQKYDRRKRKITTPKRRTPAKRRTPGRRTPGSSRKRMTFSNASKPTIPTRETSKRALFQSPPQQKPKSIIPVDVARRVDRSRRMLFSPQSEKSTVNELGQINCTKRRRDEDGLLGNQSKIPRIGSVGFENTTPRSMFAKSQTFCVSKTTNNDLKINETSVYRSTSDATLHGSQYLSQSHRRKLLWAVSTSLGKKNINSKHPKFTAYATVLAKVIKRLFLESRDGNVSTSDTMIRIADRHVFWVIQGKTVDEIYFNEKIRKENIKASHPLKLSGYIAPEDYEKLKKSIPKTTSSFPSQSSMDSFGFSQNSFTFNIQSQSSIQSQNSDAVLNDLSLSNNCFNETHNLNSETVSNALCNSSSKSNNGSALRENIRENERQKSGQKIIEFSGKDQKNISPYHDSKFGGGSRSSNIMNVKRQISFDA